MNLLNIRTWGDLRAFIHVAAPLLATLAIASNWTDGGTAQLLVTLLLAVTSPALATINTANGFRRWFYPVLAAVTAVLIARGYITEADYANWLPIITLLLGPAVAAANTPTSVDGEVVSVVDTEVAADEIGG